MAGTLYVVSTPIGNLGDISARAIDTLRNVSVIACEDTRVTRRLLQRYNIPTRTVSYHEHNERRRALELVERLKGGEDVALASDAGTPGISDPGYRLVKEARRQDIRVLAVPGASAMLAALAVSGLPISRFCFYGFLPTGPAARKRALDGVVRSPHTVVVFESARRITTLLEELAERMGQRPAFIAREMTKIHEEHRSGTLKELAAWAGQKRLQGEVTLVVSGPTNASQRKESSSRAPEEESETGFVDPKTSALFDRFKKLTSEGLARREAVKTLAHEYGLPARRVYRQILEYQSLARRHSHEAP